MLARMSGAIRIGPAPASHGLSDAKPSQLYVPTAPSIGGLPGESSIARGGIGVVGSGVAGPGGAHATTRHAVSSVAGARGTPIPTIVLPRPQRTWRGERARRAGAGTRHGHPDGARHRGTDPLVGRLAEDHPPVGGAPDPEGDRVSAWGPGSGQHLVVGPDPTDRPPLEHDRAAVHVVAAQP